MHFQLLFYLKVLGTKETALADRQPEKNVGKKISSKTVLSTLELLVLYQHYLYTINGDH